jgi:WD40 repeat protein
VLARNVAPKGRVAYARSRGLLAYGCDPANVCIWDTRHDRPISTSKQLSGLQPAGLAFSPSEAQLGIIESTGVLRVFDISDPNRPNERTHIDTNHGVALLFIDENAVAIATADSVRIVRAGTFSKTISIGEPFLWDTSNAQNLMAVATIQGNGLLIDLTQMSIVSRISLCHGPASGLKFLTQQGTLAYSCREGTVGIWNSVTRRISPLVHLEGHADMISSNMFDNYLVAAGGNGIFTVIDLETKLVSSYRGHRARLTTITPATQDYPFLISADVRGALRVWPLPSRYARVAANVRTRFVSASFQGGSSTVVATTFRPDLAIFSPSNGLQFVGPHIDGNIFLEVSANGDALATYGSGESVEIWSSPPIRRDRVVKTQHGVVSKVEFDDNSADIVTAGRDGRIVRWRASGELTVLAQFDQPVMNFVRAPGTDAVVANLADGSLWQVNSDGRVLNLRPSGSQVTRLIVLTDRNSVGVGYANGQVVIIDTQTPKQRLLLHVPGAIRDIAIAENAPNIVVAAHDDIIYIGESAEGLNSDAQFSWSTFPARARRIALSQDQLLLAITTDGFVWAYSLHSKFPLCITTGTSDLSNIVISRDDKIAAVLDADGRIISLDLDMIRSTIGVRSKARSSELRLYGEPSY